MLEKIRSTLTSQEPISVMKAYFSIINNEPEWNKLVPPLQKLEHPSSNKTVISLIELVKKIDELIPTS